MNTAIAAIGILETLSKEELIDLKSAVERKIKAMDVEDKRRVIAEINDLANARGYHLSELFGDAAPKRRAKAKFQSPNDPSLTWSGFGRPPEWFKDAELSGVPRDSMLIVGPDS